ncbi:MAG: hypothetical protein R6U96_18705 [Promethearchaeia archaeon]
MCNIDEIIKRINAEILRLCAKRDFYYSARNFNEEAKKIIRETKNRETTAGLNPKWEQIKVSTKRR